MFIHESRCGKWGKPLKSKFYSLIFSQYSAIYKKTAFISLSEKAIAFETNRKYSQDAVIYLMLIFKGEILPLFISSSIVKAVEKEKQRTQYVVFLINMSQKNRKKFKELLVNENVM